MAADEDAGVTESLQNASFAPLMTNEPENAEKFPIQREFEVKPTTAEGAYPDEPRYKPNVASS